MAKRADLTGLPISFSLRIGLSKVATSCVNCQKADCTYDQQYCQKEFLDFLLEVAEEAEELMEAETLQKFKEFLQDVNEACFRCKTSMISERKSVINDYLSKIILRMSSSIADESSETEEGGQETGQGRVVKLEFNRK